MVAVIPENKIRGPRDSNRTIVIAGINRAVDDPRIDPLGVRRIIKQRSIHIYDLGPNFDRVSWNPDYAFNEILCLIFREFKYDDVSSLGSRTILVQRLLDENVVPTE